MLATLRILLFCPSFPGPCVSSDNFWNSTVVQTHARCCRLIAGPIALFTACKLLQSAASKFQPTIQEPHVHPISYTSVTPHRNSFVWNSTHSTSSGDSLIPTPPTHLLHPILQAPSGLPLATESCMLRRRRDRLSDLETNDWGIGP